MHADRLYGTAGLVLAAAARGERPALPPATRAAAMMAIVVIALLGILFVAMILLGGHWVRRQGRNRRGPAVPRDRPPIAGRPFDEIDDAEAKPGHSDL